jgi:hypothetical protein
MENFRQHLTFANVVSCMALFVALGGTGYAAIKLPKNSVGAAQIKKGAVRSSDVKNGALVKADFKKGQLPAGAKGDPGPAGAVGAQGPPGPLQPFGSENIIDESLAAIDLAPNSVTGSEVLDGSLTMTDLKGADNSGTLSFGAGAVANGRCKDFTIAVSGAQIGDAVVLSVRGTVDEGMLLYGVGVLVNDEVVMKLCNFTGGTSPAISSLPIRLFTLD